MTDARFEELVAEAMERVSRFFREEMPQFVREDMANVVVVVDAAPAPEVLADLGMEPPETLYGLYEGTPRTEREWSSLAELPDRITIFRNPILEDVEDEDEDEIFRVICETVIHEYGHHFGLSEEEIDEAEAIWLEAADEEIDEVDAARPEDEDDETD